MTRLNWARHFYHEVTASVDIVTHLLHHDSPAVSGCDGESPLHLMPLMSLPYTTAVCFSVMRTDLCYYTEQCKSTLSTLCVSAKSTKYSSVHFRLGYKTALFRSPGHINYRVQSSNPSWALEKRTAFTLRATFHWTVRSVRVCINRTSAWLDVFL